MACRNIKTPPAWLPSHQHHQGPVAFSLYSTLHASVSTQTQQILCISWIYSSSPVLIDTSWIGWGVRWCSVNAKRELHLMNDKKLFHNAAEWQDGRLVLQLKTLREKQWSLQQRGGKQKIWTYKGSGECLSWIISRMNSYQLPLRTNALLKVSVQPKQWYPVTSPLQHNQDGMGFHSSF